MDLRQLRTLVDRQAEDEGLWFDAATAPEAYLQQELRRLHAAVEACGWQPIETAPRDGTPVLVTGGIAYWREEKSAWFTITGEEYPGRRIQWPVTHWMHLPAPPKPSPEERRTG